MVKEVKSSSDFAAELKAAGEKLVVVDFFATWCGPCKRIAPTLEKLSQELTDVVFLKVDVDEVSDVASEQNVSAMPTFLFFKKGEKVAEVVGANEEKLKGTIYSHK